MPRSLLRDRIPFSSLLLKGASPGHDVHGVVIVFAAGVLENGSVHTTHRNDGRPRLRPGGRIIDGELVLDRILVDPREALSDLQSFGIGVAVGGFRSEICSFHHKRVALPMTAAVAMPFMDICRNVRASIQRN